MDNSLEISLDGKIYLVAQRYDNESEMVVIETKNLELKKKIKEEETWVFKSLQGGHQFEVGAWK